MIKKIATIIKNGYLNEAVVEINKELTTDSNASK